MAFIHPQSCECAKSELDIFDVPPTQTSIESSNVVEYNPVATISDGTPIEFNVTGTGQDYLDLANTLICVKAQIFRPNNTDINPTDQVGPVNLFLHSLFCEVDVSLNDTLVTSSNNMYPYRAYLETLLSYGPQAKQSQLTSALYYKDVAESFEDANPHDANVGNTGFVARSAWIANGRVVDMMGCLHSDLFVQGRYLPSEINMRIRLVRSRDAFCLMSTGTPYKVKIVECKLHIRKVKLRPSIYIAHAKTLEKGNAKYPIRRVVCKTFTVHSGNLDIVQESLFAGQLPTRVVIGCVENEAFNGSYIRNPFNFKHFDLSQIKLYLDGQQQTIKPLEPNYANHQYVDAYMSLFSGTGKLQKDEGNYIAREDYPGGYTLYAFDLTPDLADEGHFNLVKNGNLRLEMKFAQALPHTINVIAYAEFENVLQIDRNRNVIYDYKN